MKLRFINHLLVVVSVFYSFIGYAHDTDKAYFKIQEEKQNTIIFAEFPWSIRRVIDNIPTKNNESIQDKMFNYLKENLILENEDGYVLPFEKVELIKVENEEGHHSMVNYKIYFKGNDWFKVTNTVMCDHFKDQLNYHSLLSESDIKITSLKEPSFVLNPSNSYNYYYYLIFFLPLVGLIFFFIKKRIWIPINKE